MQSSIDVQKMHVRYEGLPQPIQFAIDQAYDAAVHELQIEVPGFKPVGDDIAEELIAAITHYYLRALEVKS